MAWVDRVPGGPKVGRTTDQTLIAFVSILLAYTTQTESTQHIQHALGYEKPLLLLYVTHSSFMLLLPLQLVLLKVGTQKSISSNVRLLQRDTQKQVDYVRAAYGWAPAATPREKYTTLACILCVLTVGITIPALSWFIAVPLTSMANITSIYNTFSIWALVFSVLLLGQPWNYLFAVVFGALGVVMVAYGSTPPSAAALATPSLISPPLIGNVLALFGAVTMALYEVVYKLVATVPDTHPDGFRPVASSEHALLNEENPEEPPPFGLHAIAMTSGIGLVTFLVFWIVLVVAHFTGFEPFALPPNATTVGWIVLGAGCGVIFNGCFSILLSLWGPVLASMSCLLTTVLVQLTDVLLGVPFTWVGLAGCAVIATSFSFLLA